MKMVHIKKNGSIDIKLDASIIVNICIFNLYICLCMHNQMSANEL